MLSSVLRAQWVIFRWIKILVSPMNLLLFMPVTMMAVVTLWRGCWVLLLAPSLAM